MKTYTRHTGIKAAFAKVTGRTELKDTEATGLYLRINGDRGVFIYRYKFQGMKRAYTLPDIEVFSNSAPKAIGEALNKARAAHAALRGKVKAGQDPAIERNLQAQEINTMPTVAQFADTYITMYAKPNKKSWSEDERQLKTDVVPALGLLPLDQVKRSHVVALLDKKQKAGAMVARNRLISLLSKFFNYAIERGHIEVNPARGIKRTKEQSKERALSHEEIVFFWSQTGDESNLSPVTRLALRMVLITGQRPGEVRQMSMKQIKDGVWHMADTKNGKPHSIPLSELALQVVEDTKPHQRNGLLFASAGGAVMGINTLPRAMKRMQWSELPATAHDLRRTAITEISKLGFNRLVQDKIANHVDSSIGGVYDRHDYMKEKRQALDAWSRKLSEIIGEQYDSNVVELRTAFG